MCEGLDHIRIADLLSRKICGDQHLTSKEEQELENWLLLSTENKNIEAQLSNGELFENFEQITELADRFEHWQRIERFICLQRRKIIFRRCSSVAAIILLFSLSFYYFFSEPDKNSETLPLAGINPGTQQAILVLNDGQHIPLDVRDTLFNIQVSDIEISSGQIRYDTNRSIPPDTISVYNTIIVPRGGIYSLMLSDGSKVFLNSESELTYPVRFSGNVREVKLKGEAFFEVKHRLEHPFIVKSGEVETRVLGTTFNVMAYEDEPEIQTTLMEGKVEVSVLYTGLQKILEPGYQSCWDQRAERLEVRQVNIRLKSLWRDGIIILDDDDLESVLRMLGRWYDVDYVFDGSVQGSHTFTGRIDRNENLESVLRNLTLLGGPHFKIENKVIHVLDQKINR